MNIDNFKYKMRRMYVESSEKRLKTMKDAKDAITVWGSWGSYSQDPH